jgi:pimeloyl-ACP methyl ester carboxylesterase
MMLGYDKVGDGEKNVIVLHGWFGDHTVWRPTFSFLDTSQFTYVFPDYRGYGLSRTIAGDYSIEEAAHDVLALADALGWKQFAVVGHSMGGVIGQRVATMAPDRVTSLVGVTPAPATGISPPPDVERLFDAVPYDDDAAVAIVGASLGGRLAPRVAEYIVHHMRQSAEQAAVAKYGEAFRKADFGQEAAAAIKNPVHILMGEHDHALPEDFLRPTYEALYKHAEFFVVAGSGHYPMLETPAALVTAIEQRLSA